MDESSLWAHRPYFIDSKPSSFNTLALFVCSAFMPTLGCKGASGHSRVGGFSGERVVPRSLPPASTYLDTFLQFPNFYSPHEEYCNSSPIALKG